MSDLDAFKNFHRNLCKRFGHHHDEADWRRDQLSLEEHIASKLDAAPLKSEHLAAILGALHIAENHTAYRNPWTMVKDLLNPIARDSQP